MNQIYEKLVKCADAVKSKIKFQPKVALILGSGLGDYAETMQVEETMEYTEIEGFPVSTVAGHKGRFLFGYVEGVPVVAMQGRVHFYEGYPMQDVVLPVRLMGMLGAKIVMLTNAAGGVNFDFHPGDLMLITDQITTAVPSPLIGPNIEELGVRFPDMSEVYNKELQDVIRKAGANTGVALKEGVYMQFTGPCEAMAARHMGMKVCGISCITNLAAGMSTQKLDHKEVQETADRVAEDFKRLVTESIRLIGETLA